MTKPKTELLKKLKKKTKKKLLHLNYGTNQRVRYWQNSKTYSART